MTALDTCREALTAEFGRLLEEEDLDGLKALLSLMLGISTQVLSTIAFVTTDTADEGVLEVHDLTTNLSRTICAEAQGDVVNLYKLKEGMQT